MKKNSVKCARLPIKQSLSNDSAPRTPSHMAATPRVDELRKSGSDFNAMTRTLSWKMRRATKILMESLQTKNGRRIVRKTAKEIFSGNNDRAMSFLVAKLQSEVSNCRHERLVCSLCSVTEMLILLTRPRRSKTATSGLSKKICNSTLALQCWIPFAFHKRKVQRRHKRKLK